MILSDADAYALMCVYVCVSVLPLGVVQVFVWSIQVPTLAFLSTFCVVHGSSVIFPITVDTLNYARGDTSTHRHTHPQTHTEQQLREIQNQTIKNSVFLSLQWLMETLNDKQQKTRTNQMIESIE